jgi:hypothetical protein
MILKIKKTILLCLNGGLLYCWIEYFWRGWTHWSMLIIAMIISLLLDQINEHLNWDTPIWLQAIVGGLSITVIELLAGLVLNVWMGLNVWDYSNLPWNLWGQVCLGYSLLWVILAVFAFVLFDFLRWFLFREDMPRYTCRWKYLKRYLSR